jgi:hypothetical protein
MSSVVAGIPGLILSSVMLCWSSLLIVHHAAETRREGFWIFIATTQAYLGLLCVGTSLFTRLTAPVWLVMQFAGFVVTVFLLRSLSPRSFKLFPVRPVEAASRLFSDARSFLFSLSPPALAILFCAVVFLFLSGLTQYLTPIVGGDERMYHASRVLYWIQNRSVFPYVTHNDRQNVFSFGSELYFLFPILFTKTEIVGRMMLWLGYPMAVVGLYSLLRELGANMMTSLVSILVFVATPIVIRYSIGLKPEIWLAVFVLGTGFWAVRACKRQDRVGKPLFLTALFSILSVNAKFTALAFLPAVLALPWLIGKGGKALRVRSVLGGIVAGLLLSGLIVTFGFNLTNHGHILGPKAMQEIHSSDISPVQIYTHAVRLPFLLLELPEMPSSIVRGHLGGLGNDIIAFLGADEPLPLEKNEGWPGLYVYAQPEYANKFSLGGIVWLPMLTLGVLRLVRDLIASYPDLRLNLLSVLVTLDLPLLCGDVFLVRWMVHSGVPERFLVAPYALGLAISMVLLRELVAKHKFLRSAAIVLVVYLVYIPLRLQLLDIDSRIVSPIQAEQVDEPFSEAMGYIPAGSHILFVGSQGTRDYSLFAPRDGYANRVTSWGKLPFDSARMQDLIRDNQITHVLIEDERAVGFLWSPHIATVEMVTWLANHADFSQVVLQAKRMRLFETVETRAERSFELLQVPSQTPLIIIDPSLKGQVGVDFMVRTPWPVEDAGSVEQGFLWLGTGLDEGLESALWSKERRRVILRFDVLPGPSRSDSFRTVELSAWTDGQTSTQRETFAESTLLSFVVQLEPGQNHFHFLALDEATIPVQPNGDARHLVVGLRQLLVIPHFPETEKVE